MAKSNKEQGDVYAVSDKVKETGYRATIDGKLIVITAATDESPAYVEMQNGFNPSTGEPVMDRSEQIESPSDQMLWELVNAGVIVLNDEQKKSFNAKFFSMK